MKLVEVYYTIGKARKLKFCMTVSLFTDLLNVVVGEGAAVLQLFTSEDQPLLIRRDSCIQHILQSVFCNNVCNAAN